MSKKGKQTSKPYAGKSALGTVVKRPKASTVGPISAPGLISALSDVRLRRVDFKGTLMTLGPIHIGTGEVDFLPNPGSNAEQPEFGLIWRDLSGQPWLPPTTLKGVLRALDEEKDDDHRALFGSIAPDEEKDDDHRTLFGAIAPKALMGALRFKGAAQLTEGSAIGSKQTLKSVSILTRTAIDGGRGTARRNQLFSKEYIGAGAKFTFSLRLEGRQTQVDFDRLRLRAIRLLELLSAADGVTIGAHGKQGEGRIQLQAGAKCQHWQTSTRADTLGALIWSGNAELPKPADRPPRTWLHEIMLQCSVPFLISDGHYDRAIASGQNAPHLIPVRVGKEAVTSASSILGVLRARARWLVAIAGLRAAEAPSIADSDVDLLFGTTGQKGLIRVQIDRKIVSPAPIMTQVKLDRFSGAGIEGALVSTQGDLATIHLKLDLVGSEAGAKALLDLLVRDLKTHGLRLGHSTTRGFGWFDEVKV